MGVSLDIQAAFDSVYPYKIKEALLKHGGDRKMVNWYYNYLIHRNIICNMQGVTLSVSTSRGFPQGGVNSADFWIIVFNPALEIINSNECNGDGFADDLLVMKGCYSVNAAIIKLQGVMDRLIIWGKTCGLTFNPDKTVVVIFSRKRLKPYDTYRKLTVEGKCVEFSTNMKYLGVTMDCKMSWKQHIEGTIKDCKRALMSTSNIIKTMWGPRPSLSKWLYTGIIRPKLLYAAIVWGHKVNTATIKRSLTSLNRLALCTITPTKRSTPTKGLEVIYDLLPCEKMIEQMAIMSLQRQRHIIQETWAGEVKHNKMKGHIKHWIDVMHTYDIQSPELDRCKEREIDKKYTVNLDSMKSPGAKHLSRTLLNIYTDGSKTEEGTGCGFAIYNGSEVVVEKSYGLVPEATIFQAEAEAVTKAIEWVIEQEHINKKYIKIFSDSQAVVKALASANISSKTLHRTAKALNKLGDDPQVRRLTITWIKAHVGHEGNEAADGMARLGTTETNMINLPLAAKLDKREIVAKIRERWEQEWQTEKTCRQTRFFFPKLDSKKSKNILMMGRLRLMTLIPLITGHNLLAYPASKEDPQICPRCRLCGEADETFIHFVTDCPRLWTMRREILQDSLNIDSSWHEGRLLEFSHIPAVEALLSQDY